MPLIPELSSTGVHIEIVAAVGHLPAALIGTDIANLTLWAFCWKKFESPSRFAAQRRNVGKGQ